MARCLLARAVARGAIVEVVHRLPPPTALTALALVDGTGRTAAWSRPVVATGRDVAWQFEGPPLRPWTGGLVHGEGWWAYRLGHPSATWVGIVTGPGPLPQATARGAFDRLGVPPEGMVGRGRRPARIQRAHQAWTGRRIAVGDAALAHNPLAGAGIRFALASAVAAVTALATTVEDASAESSARAYYEEMVRTEHDRHVQALAALQRPPHPAPPPNWGGDRSTGVAPSVVRFGAELVEAPLVVEGRVRSGQAVRLPDGRVTRWAGSFDLLQLVGLVSEPVPTGVVVARLQQLGLTAKGAASLVSWAARNGLLVG
nr:hypothetical protein [uncultured bacterium]